MAKLRRKRSDTREVTRDGFRLTSVDVPQPRMIVVRDMSQLTTLGTVKGAYIKIAPQIRVSERSQFDSKAVREELLAAGAVAVVVAPTVVPDERRQTSDKPQPIMTPETLIREWFEGVKLPAAVKKAAIEEALTSVRDAGL